MNIKITHNWLLDYLETPAGPYDLQKYLSLCGPSFERVFDHTNDYSFDIEVTANRVDMASVLGVAQEAQAILPRFNIAAQLKQNPSQLTFKELGTPTGEKKLEIHLTDPSLCSRFAAIVLSDIKIGPAPDYIRERLRMCDIKSINNVVDISNYLMVSLGQPTHMFDYDKLKQAKMTMRESRPGEIVKTLDEKEIELPGGDIVMEDGEGNLFDLCGIMGGDNSAISPDTKNVILFVQTYNKRKIRRTSMKTGQRTIAATYFEKGLDEERVEPTLVYGVQLLQKYANAKINSPLYDIYPHPYTPKTISFTLHDITRIMGVTVSEKDVNDILGGLGFGLKKEGDTFVATVPSHRKDDIEIKADIVEEVARVWGYHNLPNEIQTTTYVKQPKELEQLFLLQSKVKYFLKDIGLHESMNYSMVSAELLQKCGLDPYAHLALENTISEETKYFRQSLIPSLVKNMKDNQGKKDVLKLFELAKVYLPRNNDLPDEQYRLAIAVTTDFSDVKGIVEVLLRDLHIHGFQIKRSQNSLYAPHVQAELFLNEEFLGTLGQLKQAYQLSNGIEKPIFIAELHFQTLIHHYRIVPLYQALNPYAVIKLDLTLPCNKKQDFSEIKQQAFASSEFLRTIDVLSQYQDKLTLRFYFAAKDRNLSEQEAKNELEKIKKNLLQ
ncbi:phenylalanine--tRNA ligase subunit beta [Candidatus Roizmanbacteria bacterium]|nr:phenylalanine--tRNA ligase subunit beta [Candidatus Roizmanbacteria bacterium]